MFSLPKALYSFTQKATQASQSHHSRHAELQAKHQVKLLPFEPVHCVCVLSHSQRFSSNTAYWEKTCSRWFNFHKSLTVDISIQKVEPYPKTKRPNSISQKWLTNAPRANITCKQLIIIVIVIIIANSGTTLRNIWLISGYKYSQNKGKKS